jgi:hypothetical protein
MSPEEFLARLEPSETAALEAARAASDQGLAMKILEAAAQRLGVAPKQGKRVAGQALRSFFPQESKAPPPPVPTLHELSRTLPYPLGWKLASLLRDARRLDEGEGAPQFAFDLFALSSLLLRFSTVVLLRAYVEAGASDAGLNRSLVETLGKDLVEESWLNLPRSICKVRSKADPAFTGRFQKALEGATVPENERAPALRDKKGLKDVDYLVALRNLVVHGERVAPGHLRGAFDLLGAVIQRFAWLAEFELVVRTGVGGLRLEGEVPLPVETLDAALPEGEPCLVARDGSRAALSLSPLLRFRAGTGDVAVDELFFVNVASLERLQYVGFRVTDAPDGRALGSYEAFREMMKRIPTPELPKDPRLDFTQFAEEATRFFVGREDVLAAIEAGVRARTAPYLVVRALPGMGKTALLGRMHRAHPPRRPGETGPGERWIYHFCGNTDGRNSPTTMLRSLLQQLADATGLGDKPPFKNGLESKDLKELRDTHFPYLVRLAAEQLGEGERLVIAIDALDEGFGGEEPVGTVLPRVLPPNVVALVSWRVTPDGLNPRVEESLRHLPPDARRDVPGADPLRGLTRENLADFVAQVRAALEGDGAGQTPDAVLDALWRASDTGQGDADPFYLRFVAQGAETGRVDLTRAETVPASLDDAFEDEWMALPTTRDFALHRVLLWLAILREHGTDPLLAELLARETGQTFRPDDVAALRVRAGKLLVYDGDRYTLFHDRFRRFLVGEQKDPLDVAAD